LAQGDRLVPMAFFLGGEISPTGDPKKKAQCDNLYKGFFLKTFKKLVIFLFFKKKEFARFRR
jgi:hypothetical protein